VRLCRGLIPSWAKDKKIASSTINARADTIATKPAFRSAFKKRRCLVLADGFHEQMSLAAAEFFCRRRTRGRRRRLRSP
jgi:putative SOS response-associated peptidase YedK